MAVPDFTYTGQYKLTQSGTDWELRFLSSGTLTLGKNAVCDAFLVGGGGGGGSGNDWQRGGGGGGGGYTETAIKLRLVKGTAYAVVIGAGGAFNTAGSETTAFGYRAAGGAAGAPGWSAGAGGSGGSGGGSGAYIDNNVSYFSSGNGGADGSSGGTEHGGGGTGQGKTTRAYGESSGALYSGGGGGGSAVSSGYINGYYGTRNSGVNAPGGSGGGGTGGGRNDAGAPGTANTGGGGGGGGCNSSGGSGGSGIVLLRNTRYGATTLISAKDGAFGAPVQITLSRDSSKAVHTVTAVLLDPAGKEIHTAVIAQKTAAYPTISWTPAVSVYAPLIKNAASAKMQLKCLTYEDGEEQGEEELAAPITLSFRAADVAPKLGTGAVTVEPYNTGAAAGLKCFAQGFSQADSVFDDSKITLAYGAAIARREVICAGVSAAASPYRTAVLTGDTELIARVTDSRGFTAEQSITVKVEPYAKPRLSGVSIFRCDDSGGADEAGGRLCAKASAVISSLAGENSCTLTAAVKALYGSYGAEQGMTSAKAKVLSGTVSPDESYVVRITATDALGGQVQYEQTISHRKWVMKFRPNGEGVAFGKAPASDKVLELAEGWEIKRGQQTLPWSISDASITKAKLASDVTALTLGGISIKLLWTNPSPAASFAAQTVTLPAGTRQMYLIQMRESTGNANYKMCLIRNVTNEVFILNLFTVSSSSEWSIMAQARKVKVNSNTALQFYNNEYGRTPGYANDRNDINYPVRIYGITGIT